MGRGEPQIVQDHHHRPARSRQIRSTSSWWRRSSAAVGPSRSSRWARRAGTRASTRASATRASATRARSPPESAENTLSDVKVSTVGTGGAITADLKTPQGTQDGVAVAVLDLSAVRPGQGEGGAMADPDGTGPPGGRTGTPPVRPCGVTDPPRGA